VSDSGPPIDPRDLDLLRRDEPAPSSAKARVRARLATIIPAMSGGGHGGDGGGTSGTGPKGASAAAAGLGSKGGAIAAAFVMGGIVGAALYAGLARPLHPQVIYVDRPVAAPPSSAPARPAPIDVAAPPTTPAPTAAQLPHPVSSTTRVSQLSAERMILDDARAALARHDAQSALVALERHRVTFPRPLLAEERDAMQVQALVAAGRYDEARTHADAFHEHNHDSLFLHVVDTAIASIP
jgi:hypothetical protein